MIETIHNPFFHEPIQGNHIRDQARACIQFSVHRHEYRIIMPMSVKIITFAKNFLIEGIWQLIGMQSMGGTKRIGPCDGGCVRHNRKSKRYFLAMYDLGIR
jgi:hypothetical protein